MPKTIKDILEEEYWAIPWKAVNCEIQAAELLNKVLNDIIKRNGHLVIRECPDGLCDGTGYIQEGQHDCIEERRCLCNPKVESDDMDDDS